MRLLCALTFIALACGCICCGPGGVDSGTTTSTLEETTTTLKPQHTTTTIKHGKTTTTVASATTIPAPKDRESCEALGGRWGRIGTVPRESCNLPTSDGGKECSDVSECEGSCIADLSPAEYAKVQAHETVESRGKCTGYRITVGCLPIVEDGRVRGLLCVD